MKPTLLFALLSLFVSLSQAQTPSHRRTQGRPRLGIQRTSTTSRTTSDQTSSIKTQSLAIRRVILYSNGVAYIERRGMVAGHAEVNLSFKQSQVDDVLKSMVVLDLGKGRIGAVSYNSTTPASTRMAEIPFAISASTDGNNGGGLAGVLSQLQGARVIVTTANRVVTGALLTVEAKHSQFEADKPAETTYRVIIASDNGELSGFDLSEVRSVQLTEEGTRRDVTQFAHAAASARRRDAKTIVVTSDGIGEREMVISYTIAAPIWKTTYRVVLDSSGKPFFQGWAIVDNVSEEDWNNVQLSLVSGTPVSFIQPIQNPVYRYRPVIPLSEYVSLKPQTYEPALGGSLSGNGAVSGVLKDSGNGAVGDAKIVLTNVVTQQTFEVTTNSDGEFNADSLPVGRYNLNASANGFKNLMITDVNVMPGVKSSLNLRLEAGNVSEVVTVTGGGANNSIAAMNYNNIAASVTVNNGSHDASTVSMIIGKQSGVEAETSTSEIGDLFEYRVDQPVSVPRDRSALIPIVQTTMGGVRVSIFNEKFGQAHRPMSGMLLKNTTQLTLEDGSLTVLDGDAYAGEALLARLKPEEERLISFAVDLGVLVNVDDENGAEPTFFLRAVNGIVQTYYYKTRKKLYTLVNQTDRPRILYIEHPKDNEDEEWELSADMPKPVVTTAHFYRFRVKLEPHQKLEFPVTERSEQYTSYALSQFTRKDLELFIARKYVDEPTRVFLERLINLRDQIASVDARLQQINKEAGEISQDQQRLRDNIKALTATAEAKQLISRYVGKANEQETRLEEIEKSRRALADERARLQAELDAAIRSLSIERELK